MLSRSSDCSPGYDLDKLRKQFEVTHRGVTYLNHAGMSPLPIPVKQAMIDAIEAMAQRGSLVYADLQEPLFHDVLESAGRLLHVSYNEIALTESTLMGLNIIANSLPLRAGDQVLVCDTEFPSNVYPWQNLVKKGIETTLVPTADGGLTLEALDSYRTHRTRVVAVSAVQFFSGRREDLTELGRYCGQYDLWFVVDAMQAAGIVPIDMQAMGIHALSAGGQKALLAPPGQGVMAIRADLMEQMKPIFVGPLSVVEWDHWLEYKLTLQPGARRFDMGTSNLAGLAGLGAALHLLLDLHVDDIADWVTHLSNVAIADLEERGFRFVTPSTPARHAHIVTFAVDSSPEDIVAALQSSGIILRSHNDAKGNPYLRISSHAYNTEQDILRVGEALEELSYEQH